MFVFFHIFNLVLLENITIYIHLFFLLLFYVFINLRLLIVLFLLIIYFILLISTLQIIQSLILLLILLIFAHKILDQINHFFNIIPNKSSFLLNALKNALSMLIFPSKSFSLIIPMLILFIKVMFSHRQLQNLTFRLLHYIYCRINNPFTP